MTDENERVAATLKVGISNYVGTATLAVTAGGVAILTYVQQNFSPSGWFYATIGVAFLALVISLFAGGRGANSTAEEVAGGSWTTRTQTPDFNVQAIFALVGLGLLLAATALGMTSAHRVQKDPCVGLLAAELSRPQPDVKVMQQELRSCQSGG